MGTRNLERTQIYADIITTAVEGGIGYWSAVSEYKWAGLDPADIFAVIHEFDEETGDYDGTPIRLDVPVVVKGFNLLAKQVNAGDVKNEYFVDFVKAVNVGDWNAADFDAEIADVIVQLGLFDSVVYG